MHVEYAQLPPPEDSADRIFIANNAVIVLDGATALVPVEVTAQTYAQNLGRSLVDELQAAAATDLTDVLAAAIAQTAKNLELNPGEAPSSTVAIIRERTDAYDLLVLGDTTVLWGEADTVSTLYDDRLQRVARKYRDQYRNRLAAGSGYDNQHRRIIRRLQEEQRKLRNTPDGYWIAEACPEAAEHSLTTTVDRAQIEWALVATEGAFEPLKHLARNDWSNIATFTSAALLTLLNRIRAWEQVEDPRGCSLPRAKVHDDKSIATVR